MQRCKTTGVSPFNISNIPHTTVDQLIVVEEEELHTVCRDMDKHSLDKFFCTSYLSRDFSLSDVSIVAQDGECFKVDKNG